MKKYTGTLILTAALLSHVAIAIATEESYIFKSTDAEIPLSAISTVQADISTEPSPAPIVTGSAFNTTGFYFADEQQLP